MQDTSRQSLAQRSKIIGQHRKAHRYKGRYRSLHQCSQQKFLISMVNDIDLTSLTASPLNFCKKTEMFWIVDRMSALNDTAGG